MSLGLSRSIRGSRVLATVHRTARVADPLRAGHPRPPSLLAPLGPSIR